MTAEFSSQIMQSLPVESQEQKQLAKRATEVADSVSELPKITGHVRERIESSPSSAIEIAFVGEPGLGKGTLDSQVIVKILTDPVTDGLLKAQGKKLKVHTFSTKKMMQLSEKLGMPKNAEGRPSTEGINATGILVNQLLEQAEETFPQREPDNTPLMIYELVGITQSLDLGGSIINRLAEKPNGFIVFGLSNPQTQRRAYRQRQQLHEGEDKAMALRRHHTKVDISPEELVDTMGDHISIRRIDTLVNQEMLDAFLEQKFDLEAVIPRRSYDLFQKYPLDSYSKDQLIDFFTNLTQFSDTDMRTNELRPYLQRAYYQYLAENVYKIPANQYVIVEPEFRKETVHPHPGLFRKYVLDLEQFIAPEDQSGENVIFSTGLQQ